MACAVALAVGAQNTGIAPSYIVSDDNHLYVNVDMDLSTVPVKSNQTVVYIPYLANGADTLELANIAVLGRRNFIQYERGNLRNILPAEATVFKESEIPEAYRYSATLECLPWFAGATLNVKAVRYGCAGCSQGAETFGGVEVVRPIQFVPSDWTHYVRPRAEGVKIRNIEGSAKVEFPVNKTELLSDFRKNYAELDSIRSTIDVVRNDKNCSIKTMAIRGFASPEGSYANNTRLAKGRTEALCSFVEQMYSLPKGFINASYEPEDWAGLRLWVANSNIDNRESILEIIDDKNMDVDIKDRQIQARYPEQHRFLLEHVYPALRHSDYRIDYEVRSFCDPAEILEVMHRRPKNLSLEELFVAAQSLDSGTPEFNEVVEVAVRLFPDSEEANLNAGINAMNLGEYDLAATYLERAGTSANTDYARAVLAIATKDWGAARELLKKATDSAHPSAQKLLLLLDKMTAEEK